MSEQKTTQQPEQELSQVVKIRLFFKIGILQRPPYLLVTIGVHPNQAALHLMGNKPALTLGHLRPPSVSSLSSQLASLV